MRKFDKMLIKFSLVTLGFEKGIRYFSFQLAHYLWMSIRDLECIFRY